MTRPVPADCCPRCWQRREVCFCARYPRVETRTEIVIVRQAIEAGRTSNTARIAQLALPNCRILEYGGGMPFAAHLLEGEESWLLYPEGGGPEATTPPKRLVVLDGTWKQARKMFLRIAPLRRMPRLALTPSAEPKPRLRKPPSEGALSTLEAIAAAVRQLEGEVAGAALEGLHAELALRGLYMRGLRFEGRLVARQKGDIPAFLDLPLT